jgi:outer membrane immunogenic protein
MRRSWRIASGDGSGNQNLPVPLNQGAEMTMKKLLLSIAITAGVTGSALAADIPVKAARPVMAPPVVATSWTGCYIGAGLGYGMWNQEHYLETFPGLVATSPSATAGGRGWLGTVQGGCDYQFANRWVIGAFADYDFSRIKGTFNPVGTTYTGEESLRSSWAVGGRLGYVVVPQLLAYFSGGYTQARFNQVDMTAPGVAVVGAAVIVPPPISLPATTYSGWFLGSGYEYALDFLPGLFWKTEYRYSSFSAKDLPAFFTNTGVNTGAAIHSQKYVQTIRSELVWRFNWAAPVVAKY